MTLEERLRNALEQCSKRGWENFIISSTRGDPDGNDWEQSKMRFDTTNNGQSAALEDGVDYRDSIEVLCELLESFPESENRPLNIKLEVQRGLLERVQDHLYTLDDHIKTWNTSPDKWRRDQFSRLSDLLKAVQSYIPDYQAERSDKKRYADSHVIKEEE